MLTSSDVFEDVAVALESWAVAASEAITVEGKDLLWVEDEEPYRVIREALQKANVDTSTAKAVFSECLRGLAVSLLTVFDGGTAAAEKGRVYLTDERGQRLGEGLHDEFVAYLMDTGRLD